MLLHSTTVAIDHRAVVIVGTSGSGKSDLAVRLIDGGAILVADDQTELDVLGGHLVARAPRTLAGLIEVRHVGLLRLPCLADIPVSLCVESADSTLERLPAKDAVEWLGCRIPRVRLDLLLPSTPAKIRMMLFYPVEHV